MVWPLSATPWKSTKSQKLKTSHPKSDRAISIPFKLHPGMNPPPSSGNRPRPGRMLWIAVLIALFAVIFTYALRIEKTKPETPSAAKPLETISIPVDAGKPETLNRVRAALEADDDPRGLSRVEALRSIDDDLTRSESNALLGILLKPRDPSAPEGVHSVVFHETALALHRHAAVRREFARTLATVARDPGRDPVIRDYAVQHLCQLWQKSERDLAERIQATLDEIADESPDIAPSALLALHLLGASTASGISYQESAPYAVPDAKIAKRVRTLLAAEAGNSTASRMTALRIVGERRLSGFHDDLARIAADHESGHTLVRMAAVAAIARFGDPHDLPLLRSFDRSDPRMASAIDHAIARIESKP
jgi:hypothetical protein